MKNEIIFSKSYAAAKIQRGKNKDCCLVFVHGFSESGVCWDGIIQTLQGRANFVTYDCAGHGNNAHLWPKVSFTSYVVQLEKLTRQLKKEGFNKIVLVGHSQGAAIAAQCALSNSENVDGLILISSFFTVKDPLNAIWTNYLKMLQAGDVERFWDMNSSLLLGPKSASWSHLRRRAIEQRLEFFSKDQLKVLIKALLNVRVSGDISRLGRKPIYLIHGEYDLMFPTYYSKEILAKIPKAAYVEMKGANHLLGEMEPNLSLQVGKMIDAVGRA